MKVHIIILTTQYLLNSYHCYLRLDLTHWLFVTSAAGKNAK